MTSRDSHSNDFQAILSWNNIRDLLFFLESQWQINVLESTIRSLYLSGAYLFERPTGELLGRKNSTTNMQMTEILKDRLFWLSSLRHRTMRDCKRCSEFVEYVQYHLTFLTGYSNNKSCLSYNIQTFFCLHLVLIFDLCFLFKEVVPLSRAALNVSLSFIIFH